MRACSILQHLAVLAWLLCACAIPPGGAAPAVGTATAFQPADTQEPPTATATIVWFPPTETPTARPLVAPTPTTDYLVGLGAELLTDTFEDAAAWSASLFPSAGLIVSRNRLTMAVPSGLFQASLRLEPSLRNFYAEVTAQTNLCRGRDEYGVLFRAQGTDTGYRLVLNCDGQVRLDRLNGGGLAYLVPLQPSGDAPPGAPGEVRIGVWALGPELRLFLNGHFLVSIRDPLFAEGRLGFYARPAGTTPLNVAFSNLVVRAVDSSPPTPTPGP